MGRGQPGSPPRPDRPRLFLGLLRHFRQRRRTSLVAASFSGVLAVDEGYDGDYAILVACDPLTKRTVKEIVAGVREYRETLPKPKPAPRAIVGLLFVACRSRGRRSSVPAPIANPWAMVVALVCSQAAAAPGLSVQSSRSVSKIHVRFPKNSLSTD